SVDYLTSEVTKLWCGYSVALPQHSKKIVQTSHGEKDFFLKPVQFRGVKVNFIKNIFEAAARAIRGGKENYPAQKAAPVQTSTSYFIAPYEPAAADSRQNSPALQYGTWAYACIQRIAEGVAQVPFRVSRYKPGTEMLVESGRLYELLRQPHPLLTQFDFFELIVCWLMARGKAFILPLDEAGKPVDLSRRDAYNAPEIYSLQIPPPENFKKIVSNGALIGWRYRTSSSSKEVHLFPEEVIYIRLPFINDFYDGFSPLAVAALAAQTDIASAQYMKAIMSNNGETGLIIKTDQPLTEEQRAQIISALQSRKRGGGAADRPIILEAGLEIISPSLTSADLQFLENRKFNRQEICAVFGVPQEILGFTEDANRSVSQSARANFFENRIIPLCRRIEFALKPLLSYYDKQYVGWFDIDSMPVMQERRLGMVETAERLWRMGIPFNDINRCLELGFPNYRWHKYGYIEAGFRQIRDKNPYPYDPDEYNNM
ncbi:MAG: phage portal protein, partial [Verrucomicrobiia bacterium]